jgi:hypothetical protein
MPAIPVAPARPEEHARERVFEQGDHIYITAPVQLWTPNDQQLEELAFADSVAKMAPNEHIVWFRGQYVEADNPNANGAQWTSGELAMRSLTPMLMPVTVMHDPRTAVGVIADAKLLTPEKDNVPRARIDTVLALWGHRFPEAAAEAVENARQGTLMQSMECFTPWYSCSECGQRFTKLPGGVEQAMWCDHLKSSSPTGGYVDLAEAASGQRANASRILGDVTFTGTGLIYGTRGARGAYSDAYLENFMAEVASHLRSVHVDNTSPTQRSGTGMGLVQIEQSELDTLRKERDDAKAEATAAAQAKQEAEGKVEAAEAAKVAAEEKAQQAETKVTTLEETARATALRDERIGALGDKFLERVGETARTRLQEQAKSMSDEDWNGRLTELEEIAQVKRDEKKDGSTPPAENNGGGNGDGPTFGSEELARLGSGVTGGGGQPSGNGSEPSRVARKSVASGLAKALTK